MPLGIADYQLVESLPKELDAGLPSIARIEEELGKEPTPKATRPAKEDAARVTARRPRRRRADGKSPADELVAQGNQHVLDELRTLASTRH